MTDFLFSPEGAKEISFLFFGAIVLVYALRFGLPWQRRHDIVDWVKRHTHIAG
jgi:hypothetical protein